MKSLYGGSAAFPSLLWAESQNLTSDNLHDLSSSGLQIRAAGMYESEGGKKGALGNKAPFGGCLGYERIISSDCKYVHWAKHCVAVWKPGETLHSKHGLGLKYCA